MSGLRDRYNTIKSIINQKKEQEGRMWVRTISGWMHLPCKLTDQGFWVVKNEDD